MKASQIFQFIGIIIVIGLIGAIPHLMVRLIDYKKEINKLEAENKSLISALNKHETIPQFSARYNGMFLRVQDSVAYRIAADKNHAVGFSDMYFNDEAEKKHWDIWDGEKYQCVFNFNAQ